MTKVTCPPPLVSNSNWFESNSIQIRAHVRVLRAPSSWLGHDALSEIMMTLLPSALHHDPARNNKYKYCSTLPYTVMLVRGKGLDETTQVQSHGFQAI